MANVQVSRKEFETYLRIKQLFEEGHKYEDLVQITHSSLIILKEWRLGNLIAYQTLQVTLGF